MTTFVIGTAAVPRDTPACPFGGPADHDSHRGGQGTKPLVRRA
jgi:hypothetical protein